jgi:hypothetical protein
VSGVTLCAECRWSARERGSENDMPTLHEEKIKSGRRRRRGREGVNRTWNLGVNFTAPNPLKIIKKKESRRR